MWLSRWTLRMMVKQRRFWIKSFKIFNPKTLLTDSQDLSIAIVRKAISHPDAELFMAPATASRSGARYIRYKDIFISIENGLIAIINGTYSYHISIPEREMYHIVNKFNFRLENIRKIYEATIRNKTKRNLTNVLVELQRTS